jgi:hypothetical protein
MRPEKIVAGEFVQTFFSTITPHEDITSMKYLAE